MTARWEHIKELFMAALEQPAEERDAFLDNACGEDQSLRAEIDRLLAHHEHADESFLESPIPNIFSEIDAALTPGEEIGHYKILRHIGTGGMGEVYRARDLRLKRDVALKVLPAAVSSDPERMARFQREAEVLASLNHPNIAQIYGIDEQALVMELVEGKTLRGPLPIRTALDVARQMTEALEYAHGQGVVHRDLKPANLMLTPTGVLKVLDFGLAKAIERRVDAVGPSDIVTATLTANGKIMGTVAYMSPEQAAGRTVDKRSDIWSFGVVLWEMLTGARLFEAESLAETFANVLQKQVEFDQLPRETPAPIRNLLVRCLERDVKSRLPELAQARVVLRKCLDSPGSGSAGVRIRPRRPRRRVLAAAALLAIVVVATALVLSVSRTKPLPGPEQWRQVTNFPDAATSPALSRDGRMLAFTRGTGWFVSNKNQIYVKILPNGPAVQYTHDGLAKMFPSFSPDGSRIAYTVGGFHTWVMPVLAGGEPQLMLSNAEGLTWINAQHVLFSEQKPTGMAVETALENRAAEREIYLPADGMAHFSSLSPDGKQVLVVEMTGTGPWLPCRLVPFDGSSRGRQVGPVPSRCMAAAWTPDGRWMYFSAKTANGTHLWRQRVDRDKAEQITFGTSAEQGVAIAPDGGSLYTSVGSGHPSIWLHDARGDREISGEGSPSAPIVSLDGHRVYYAVSSAQSTGAELWAADSEAGGSRRVLPGIEFTAFTFSPDRNSILYRMADKSIWVTALDHSLPPRKIPLENATRVQLSSSGRLYFIAPAGGEDYFYRMNADGSQRQKVFPDPAMADQISPDEQWVVRRVDSAEGFVEARSVRGNSRVPVCRACVFRWSAGAKYALLWFRQLEGQSGSTVAVPLKDGAMLPPLPPKGFQNADEAAKLPGALVIPYETADVGPGLASYAYRLENLQQNIFQIPLK